MNQIVIFGRVIVAGSQKDEQHPYETMHENRNAIGSQLSGTGEGCKGVLRYRLVDCAFLELQVLICLPRLPLLWHTARSVHALPSPDFFAPRTA